MELVNSYLAKFSDFSLGPEMLFGILGVVFLILYGLSLGRTRALVSLIAIYIAYVLQAMFPYFSELRDVAPVLPDEYIMRIAVFFVFYTLTFAILNKSLVKRRLTMNEFSIFWVSLISLLQLGVLIAIIVNFTPDDKLAVLPEHLLGYFAGQRALFFWLTAPVVLFIAMRREKRSRSRTKD